MKTDGLDLDDDPKFQDKSRTVQLAGWLALVCFVLAAALGYFGKSTLTVNKVKQDGLSLEYARFLRQRTQDQLRIEVDVPRSPRSKTVSLWVSNEFLNHSDVQFVNPQPVSVEADGNENRYEFLVSEGTEKLAVTLQFAPQAAGVVDGQVRSVGQSISFRQLTYF